jgi:hypothetical protein
MEAKAPVDAALMMTTRHCFSNPKRAHAIRVKSLALRDSVSQGSTRPGYFLFKGHDKRDPMKAPQCGHPREVGDPDRADWPTNPVAAESMFPPKHRRKRVS